jgi:hypothetical protein
MLSKINDSNKSNNLFAMARKISFLNMWHAEMNSIKRLFGNNGLKAINTPPSDMSKIDVP